MTTTVAAVQMVSTPVVADNLASAAPPHRRGRRPRRQPGDPAGILADHGHGRHRQGGQAERPGAGPIQDFMAAQAREHGIWLIGGTLPLISDDAGKVLNTTLVYDPQGRPVGRYDKIHLFGFNKGSESYDEARTIVPGTASAPSRRRSAGSGCRSATTCVSRNCSAVPRWASAA
jgi:hypothetical protein